MVKVFYLGLFAAIICAFAVSYASAGPVPYNNHHRQHHPLLQHKFCNGSHCRNNQEVGVGGYGAEEDGTVRSERSTNLSHITGSARKIQMFVKSWHLQILPDGVVNGTHDETSDYTILQRTTVNIGQLKIQGVATCQYLCMDSCGLLYASKDFVDECVFNEMIEQHYYNTYSSERYSNARKTLYIALNRWGQPRRVQVRAQQQLGKLSTYARVLTKTVSLERVEDLLTRIGGNATSSSHPLRHHGGLQTCTSVIEQKAHNSDWQGVDRLRCRKRKKRKKKRRRCGKPGDTEDGEGCPLNKNKMNNNKGEVVKKNLSKVKQSDNKNNKQCEHDINNKKCQRLGGNKSDLVTVNKKKNKKQKQLQLQNANRNARKRNQNQKTFKNSNNNRKIVKKVLPVFHEDDDNTTISSASVEETSNLEIEETSIPLDESNLMDESTTMTSAMEDSEQNYDDGGSVAASSTQPTSSAEVD